jgi:hypothetical protein
VRGAWHPHLTTYKPKPEAGDLIGYRHAVWRVINVADVERDAAEAEEYVKAGRPAWLRNPYKVDVKWIGGAKPGWVERDPETVGTMRVSRGHAWDVYRDGRWPQCSCCGEPMPCRAEVQDRQIDAAMDRVEEMSKRLPGCCWGCGNPITSRQQSVIYAGENLDLPGGPDVRFHLRLDCLSAATAYETKWLSVDHSRRRMLTYPKCSGSLFWHADGSSECSGGDTADPECQGARTHAHGGHAACYYIDGGCPRGCQRVGHPGCGGINGSNRRGRWVEIRDPDLPQGILPDPPAELDRRQPCPGHLIVHGDGSSDCIAGGRDDCWGGDTYRHEVKRACHTQTHGCPRCDVGGAV